MRKLLLAAVAAVCLAAPAAAYFEVEVDGSTGFSGELFGPSIAEYTYQLVPGESAPTKFIVTVAYVGNYYSPDGQGGNVQTPFNVGDSRYLIATKALQTDSTAGPLGAKGVFISQRFLSVTSTDGGTVRLAFNGSLSPLPEPSSWTLLIGGFGLIGVAMRRRQVTARVALADV